MLYCLGDTVSHTALEKRALCLFGRPTAPARFCLASTNTTEQPLKKWLVSKRCWTVDGDVFLRRKRALRSSLYWIFERADMLRYFSLKKGPAPPDTAWVPPAMPNLVEKAKNPVGRPVITPKATEKAKNPDGRPPKLRELGKFPEIILNRSHKFSHCVV